jgi:hypothetical protein
LAKTVQKELIDLMKRNTDNQFFMNLTRYLELRITLQKDTLVGTLDMDEVKRIQGRVLELQEFLKALRRRPVEKQHTGSFN